MLVVTSWVVYFSWLPFIVNCFPFRPLPPQFTFHAYLFYYFSFLNSFDFALNCEALWCSSHSCLFGGTWDHLKWYSLQIHIKLCYCMKTRLTMRRSYNVMLLVPKSEVLIPHCTFCSINSTLNTLLPTWRVFNSSLSIEIALKNLLCTFQTGPYYPTIHS